MVLDRKSKEVKYLREELNRLEENLKRLSVGDFNLKTESQKNENISVEDRSKIMLIERHTSNIADNCKNLIKDTELLKSNILEGNAEFKLQTTVYPGQYKVIGENINQSFEYAFKPMQEIQSVMKFVEVNDLTHTVDGTYKGLFLEYSNSMNLVIERIRSVQDAFNRLAEGDTGLLEKFETIGKRSQNDRLMPAAIQTYRYIRNIITDVNKITFECMNGNLKEAKEKPENYVGGYREIVIGINSIIDAISKPLDESLSVLSQMALNDYTKTMTTDYKGEFLGFANSINDVQKRLLAAQNVAIKISKGDISELENFRKLGKRSENDKLVPAFTGMMEAIQTLIDETEMLSEAAVNGDLNVRGNSAKFQGGYSDIINGFNNTLDGVVNPINEVVEALGKMAEGSVNHSVEGKYKGAYENLINSLNSTLGILRNVITDISNVLQNISKGNLNIDYVRNYKGDYRTISDALNDIIKSLNNTLSEVNSAAEQVASGADQISQASLTLSQGAEEQASSIEEVTAALTQVSAQVKQNALSANEANKLSLTAKNDAVKGNEHMKEMQQAMYDINTASTNISKIIKVIDDIAFQTNILALNAAVEAARAGQYGKGFAVVAEEVRNLAQKSASAAKDTTTMIEGSIEKVEAGTKIANSTAIALNEIVESITKAAELVGSIALASTEQATAITQVNQAVDQVSGVIQTNSATAEESASSSEELSSQAEMLKQMVNKFKLREVQIPSSFGIENISPEVLRAIQEMYNNKDRIEDPDIKQHTEKPLKKKVNIVLEDNEFGKY
jgi:methyl-accepting chemotaxis protein